MKKSILAVMAILIMVLIIAFASPYWVLYQINKAIEHNQADQIAQYIDFPSVRASLKPQIEVLLAEKMGIDESQHPLAKWGLKLSKTVADHAVDAMINTQSIALLMQGKAFKESIAWPEFGGLSSLFSKQVEFHHNDKQANKVQLLKISTTENLEPNSSGNSLNKKNKYLTKYLNWNTFAVIVEYDSAQNSQFIFKRDGLSWKMKEIQLYQDTF